MKKHENLHTESVYLSSKRCSNKDIGKENGFWEKDNSLLA